MHPTTNTPTATKDLRLLTVTFDTYLEPWELAKFRGAMAHKVGLEHDWYHNHKEDDKEGHQFLYRYPLIQYKLHRNRPMLLCIEQGVEEAQHFFSKPDWTLRIGQKEHQMRIRNLRVKEFVIQVEKEGRSYRLHNWMPLNQENFKIYQQLEGLAARYIFLEKLIVSHIQAFATGIDWHIPERIYATITDMLRQKYISYKGIKMLVFNLHFKTNVFLPNFIGLGKGSTRGFGVVKQDRKRS